MGTKNLARTAIEGGRYNGNKHDRRQSHGNARAQERALIGRVLRDIDVADAVAFAELEHVGRCFYDKLGPCDRWMRKQVGRPWRKVHSELLALFDTRSLAGRHVVFDHMTPRPSRADGIWHVRGTSFRVDEHGILRVADDHRYRWRSRNYTPPHEIERALAWAAGRAISKHGAHYYWCEPTLTDVPRAEQRYRQARVLDAHEMRHYEALADECKKLIAR